MNPKFEIFVSVGSSARGDGVTTIEMGQVGTEAAVSDGAGDRVAVDAGSGFEDLAPSGNRIRSVSGLFLSSDPGAELFGRIDVDAKKHFGVLGAAILGTLTEIHTGRVRINPDGIDAIRNEVGFAC